MRRELHVPHSVAGSMVQAGGFLFGQQSSGASAVFGVPGCSTACGAAAASWPTTHSAAETHGAANAAAHGAANVAVHGAAHDAAHDTADDAAAAADGHAKAEAFFRARNAGFTGHALL